MLYEQVNSQYQLEANGVDNALDGIEESDREKVEAVARDMKRQLDSIASLKSNKFNRKTITTSGIGNVGIMEIITKLAVWQKSVKENSGNDLRDPRVIKKLVDNVPS